MVLQPRNIFFSFFSVFPVFFLLEKGKGNLKNLIFSFFEQAVTLQKLHFFSNLLFFELVITLLKLHFPLGLIFCNWLRYVSGTSSHSALSVLYASFPNLF